MKSKRANTKTIVGSLRKKLSDIFLLSSWEDVTIVDDKETISDIEELDNDWFVEEDCRPRSLTVAPDKTFVKPEKIKRSMTVDMGRVRICK